MFRCIGRELKISPLPDTDTVQVHTYWLETGEGEMFIQSDDAFMKKLDQIIAGENDFHKNIIRMAANLDVEELAVIEKMIRDLNSKNEPKNQ